jgi:bifunctional non-homologous end joining protein LigD
MSLRQYKAKRDFSLTTEPAVERSGKPALKKSRLRFVIQKHAARRLHYDFRLELDGVLKSWAVPKGLPLKRGEKHLAVRVEDHPLEYVNFEGRIPEGQYGAGSVMVWDQGTYEVAEADPGNALKQGKILLRLEGKKLAGAWTLVRMKGRKEGDKEPWLIIKSGEDAPRISARKEDQSTRTGRTMKQIHEKSRSTWTSHRAQSGKEKASVARASADARVAELPQKEPGFVVPMKARLVEKPPGESGWLFEIKWDGIRAIGIKKNGFVRLYSRAAREITRDFPKIAAALKDLPVSDLVVDGEIVALDQKGRPSFQLLQNIKRATPDEPAVICYYLFDLLNLQRHDLRRRPLVERKKVLEEFLRQSSDPLRYSAGLKGNPKRLLEEAGHNRLEGLMAKREDSPYEPGQRSGLWKKIKCVNEQEFVIGGYTRSQGTRQHFGAILVGYYREQKLVFAGKVGTGFDTRTLASLYERFEKLKTAQCPFSDLAAARSGKGRHGLTALRADRCFWLKPRLVCEVRFSEWTAGGILRQPVFLGLREDKPPEEVRREIAV